MAKNLDLLLETQFSFFFFLYKLYVLPIIFAIKKQNNVLVQICF